MTILDAHSDFKNKYSYILILISISVFLFGCPYISSRDINIGRKKADDRLVGDWRFIRIISTNETQPQGHHCHVRKNGTYSYLVFFSSDSSGKVAPDYGRFRSILYKDFRLLSVEACNIFQERQTNSQSVFAYYYYDFVGDTLVVSEISSKLIRRIDSAKANDFRRLIPFKDKPEFTGDRYFYLPDKK